MPSSTIRRSLALTALAAALAAVPAVATGPAGGCPPPYELFQIPSDGSRPVAADMDAKGNQDGYACQKPYKETPAEHTGAPYNVIDNRVARP